MFCNICYSKFKKHKCWNLTSTVVVQVQVQAVELEREPLGGAEIHLQHTDMDHLHQYKLLLVLFHFFALKHIILWFYISYLTVWDI